MWPADGSDIPIVVAMSGSRPIEANSVVPMPKPPMDRASMASLRRVECGRWPTLNPLDTLPRTALTFLARAESVTVTAEQPS